jgi:hypothetical protein
MHICLAQANSQVQAMVAGVKMKTLDGYKIVWNLLYRLIPGFDPTKTVDKPSWDAHGRDMIQYAAAFNLYFWLSTKCSGSHNQFNRSILFLKGIMAHHLTKIVEPLIITIKGMHYNLNDNGGQRIVYLPHHLRVSNLAQRLQNAAKLNRLIGILAVVLGLTLLRMAMTPPPLPMTRTRILHATRNLLMVICRGIRSLRSLRLISQTDNQAAGCQTRLTRANWILRIACAQINRTSPAKPAVRKDTVLTRATFLLCQFFFNDT